MSTQQVATGVGAGAVGLLAAEGVQKARERGVLSRQQARLVAGGVGLGTTALGIGALTHVIPGGLGIGAGLTGFGAGTLAWTAGRATGVAPRLTLSIPEEVDLLEPLITGAVLSLVGVGVATLRRTVQA